MKHKKHVHMISVVIILIGAFLIIRSAIVGQIRTNIKDADFQEDALQAQAGCTPPTLTNIHVENIANNGATIAWTTNQQSTSAVRLGLTSNSMSWLSTIHTPASSAGVTVHAYPLSNLQAGRTYYYRVRSSNGTCQKTSPTYSFSTITAPTGTPDITAPSVPTNLAATNLTSTGLILVWNASVDPTVTGAITSGVKGYEVYGPTSACAYGGSPGYCGNVFHTGAATYSMSIQGLTPNNTYSGSVGTLAGFAVKAYDNANNYSGSTSRLSVSMPSPDLCPNIAGVQLTVPTDMIIDLSGNCVLPPDTTAPSVPAGLTSPAKTSTSISLSWSASTDNSGSVAGYRVYMNGSASALNSSLITGTTYTATGLTASTPYTFAVKAFDAAGNASAASATLTVTTNMVTDTAAPSRPTGLSSSNITSSGFVLSWSPSTDDTLPASQIHYDVYGSSQACNVNAIAGYCGAVTGTTSMTISGLSPSTTYSAATGANAGFVVQSYDNANHYSTGTSIFTVTTIAGADVTPPTISNISASATATNATISWTTNEPATTYIDYGPTTAYGSIFNYASPLTNHSGIITGLTSGNTYHYRVKSTDASGNTATSGDLTFVAQAGPVSTSCPNNVPLRDQRQMWVWNDGGIAVADVVNTSKAASQAFFDYVDSHKVTVAYIQMNPGWFTATNSANLKNFLNVARDQHCLQIEALSGSSDWAAPYYDSTSAPTSTANTWAQQVRNFNNSITGSNAKLLGLQYDVEPYLHSWSNTPDAAGIATNTRTLNGLIDMLVEVKATIAGSGLMLDLAPPRWYDTQFALVPNVFVRRGYTAPQNKSAMKYLMDTVDIYTVQDYVVTSSSIAADGMGEVTYGALTGKKVRIGVEVGAGYGNGTSFADSPNPTCSNLNTQLGGAYDLFNAAGVISGFDGFAIEYYPTWKIMCNY